MLHEHSNSNVGQHGSVEFQAEHSSLMVSGHVMQHFPPGASHTSDRKIEHNSAHAFLDDEMSHMGHAWGTHACSCWFHASAHTTLHTTFKFLILLRIVHYRFATAVLQTMSCGIVHATYLAGIFESVVLA